MSGQRPKRRRRGFGLLVVMVLLSAMAVYAACNTRALGALRSHLDLVERQHVARWEGRPSIGEGR